MRPEQLLMMHRLGQTYHQKPSSWLRLKSSARNHALSLDFDLSCATYGNWYDQALAEKNKKT